MYRSPSFLKIPSAPVGNIGQYSLSMGSAAVFRQLVGCRTVSPEKIGSFVGGLLGGAVFGPVGERLGKEAAEYVSAFPPIWTEIEMTVYATGEWTHQLISTVSFPACPTTPSTSTGCSSARANRTMPCRTSSGGRRMVGGRLFPGRGGRRRAIPGA